MVRLNAMQCLVLPWFQSSSDNIPGAVTSTAQHQKMLQQIEGSILLVSSVQLCIVYITTAVIIMLEMPAAAPQQRVWICFFAFWLTIRYAPPLPEPYRKEPPKTPVLKLFDIALYIRALTISIETSVLHHSGWAPTLPPHSSSDKILYATGCDSALNQKSNGHAATPFVQLAVFFQILLFFWCGVFLQMRKSPPLPFQEQKNEDAWNVMLKTRRRIMLCFCGIPLVLCLCGVLLEIGGHHHCCPVSVHKTGPSSFAIAFGFDMYLHLIQTFLYRNPSQ